MKLGQLSDHAPAAIEALQEALAPRLGERLSAGGGLRDHHTQDEGYLKSVRPDLVAFPLTTDEVKFIVSQCAKHRVAITPWGAGTSLEGNALPVTGGLALDFSQMVQVLSVSAEDFTATVQPGIRRSQLNNYLRDTGLHFPIDPGADATLGGMAATRASGTTAVKFGTMKHNVMSLTAVMADASVIRTASLAPKSAAGFDLTSLLIGSEGALGIITELTVKLQPVPEAASALVVTFATLDTAVDAVVAARQYGVDVARIEFLDDHMMAAINRFSGANYSEQFTLFAEFQGSLRSTEEQAASFHAIVEEFGGTVTGGSAQPEERAKLWKARHEALYASRALAPGKRVMITDVCVPISRLADCVRECRADLDASSLQTTIAGHVGDGNFHAFIVLDPDNPDELTEAEALHHAMARRAIRMNGTCTGEHGIGFGKRELLVEELGPAVDVMTAIKKALDPLGLLNPQKIFAPT